MNYERFPAIAVPGTENTCVEGWDAIAQRLRRSLLPEASHATRTAREPDAVLSGQGTIVPLGKRDLRRTILVVECYTGVDEAQIEAELTARLHPALVVRAANAMLPPEKIERLVEPFLGGDDPLFGWLSGLTLPQFFDPQAVAAARAAVERVETGLVLVLGCGASLLAEANMLAYADLARWEAQNRFRRNEAGNLGTSNAGLGAGLQYKRAFFIDWRVVDRWKRPLIARWDFVLDTNDPRRPKLAEGEAVRRGLRHAVTRPFRVVPFFDPAPWGGQWMKEVCNLDRSAANYGWCFDCVPEENSLLLEMSGLRLEIPALDLVFYQPRALLGEAVYARFGNEFPIRFDFLDTMDGGNLSFQVHPLTEYIQQTFGMHYTQDESYYLLDAAADACVYLGLRKDVDPARMIRDLEAAQDGGPPFDANAYANRWPAKKHDHFLIPAGTVHCSGRNAMVLEISATPYIFTFKLWDWGRLGLDGKPRPINIRHGAANIQWDRTADWVRENLINRSMTLDKGEGWREERTGLDEREFIETRRHWFTTRILHHTHDGVNVLNLVAGEAAVVESPEGTFEPFPVHYAETWIVPAAVGPYTIRPANGGQECATIKAFVRT